MHTPLTLESDLIAGLATPPGSSGVAVIRLSGPDLPQRLFPLLRHPYQASPLSLELFQPRRLLRFDLVDPDAHSLIDQALLVFFPAPHSFTGEAQVEIQCHGSPVVIDQIFSLLTGLGIRAARPGEFSRRAFHHGKMDLTQAEALMTLIQAKSVQAAREAARQMEGSLGKSISSMREALLDLLAQVEADLDFSDEDINPATDQVLHQKMTALIGHLDIWLQGATWGEKLHNGMELVIAGQPNVGKSSLFNQLVGRDKAIVTDIPGTTRDLNEHPIDLHGIPVLLIDTAGLRDTDEIIEQEGIRRAHARIQQADGILLLYDVRDGLTDSELKLAQEAGKERLILVANKIDLFSDERPPLPREMAHYSRVHLSCTEGTGIAELLERLYHQFAQNPGGEEGAIIMVARQKACLQQVKASTLESLTLLNESSPKEILALTLRSALQALGALAGESHHRDLLDRIFSSFCIGK